MEDLSSENLELRPLVDNATEHARKLRQQALFLDNMIADTRESAEGALNASNAYQAIMDAINEALNASRDANTAADEALVLSNGLATEALESLEKSKELKVSKTQQNCKKHPSVYIIMMRYLLTETRCHYIKLKLCIYICFIWTYYSGVRIISLNQAKIT